MKIEIIIAPLSALVAIISAYISYMGQLEVEKYKLTENIQLEYLRTELDISKNTQLEYLKKDLEISKYSANLFLKKQLEVYLQASKVASMIVISKNEIPDKLKYEFFSLYWGNLAVFENTKVANAMYAFGELLKKHTKTTYDLKSASLTLAHACRDSLEEAWKIDLGPLKNERKILNNEQQMPNKTLKRTTNP